MSILIFRDLEGDPVAVDSAAIVAVRAGRVERDADILTDVTLISLPSCTVAVADPIGEVIAAWTAARSGPPQPAHPDARGWLFHPIQKGGAR